MSADPGYQQQGPGNLAMLYNIVSSFVAGASVAGLVADPSEETAFYAAFFGAAYALNYPLAKASDRYWHWKEPAENPEGKVFDDLKTRALLYAGGSAVLFGAGPLLSALSK